MEYVLPIAGDDRPARHATTLHLMLAFILFAVGIVCVSLYWFTTVSPNFHGKAYTPFVAFGCVLIVVSLILVWLSVMQKAFLRKKNNNRIFRWVELILMIAATVLFYTMGWKPPAMLFGMMSLVLIFALYNEGRVARAQAIMIKNDGIFLPSGFGNKRLEWKDVEQVLLRHHVLTISLADNTMIQRNVNEGHNVSATDLERWSASRVDEARATRPEAAW